MNREISGKFNKKIESQKCSNMDRSTKIQGNGFITFSHNKHRKDKRVQVIENSESILSDKCFLTIMQILIFLAGFSLGFLLVIMIHKKLHRMEFQNIAD